MDRIYKKREDMLGSRFYCLAQPGEQERHSYPPLWPAFPSVERLYLLWVPLLLTAQLVFQIWVC
jgi:hypothetical protein